MNTTIKSTFNAGAGNFLYKDLVGQNTFALNNANWLTIQVYCNNLSALPVTSNDLNKSLSDHYQRNEGDFDKLINLFSQLQIDGQAFTNNLLPTIIELSEDISNYAEAIPDYYSAMTQLISGCPTPLARNSVEEKQLQFNLTNAIKHLESKVVSFAETTSRCRTQLIELAASFQKHIATLGSDHPQPLGCGYWQYFNNEYGQQSCEVRHYVTQLTSHSSQLNKQQLEYNQNSALAGRSPTYSWIWPFGTIATTIAAGVYGTAATNAKNAISEASNQLIGLTDVQRADARLITYVHLASSNARNVSTAMNNVVGDLERIEQNWKRIAAELNNLCEIITDDVSHGIEVVRHCDFVGATVEWHDLAIKTKLYSDNAFISVSATTQC